MDKRRKLGDSVITSDARKEQAEFMMELIKKTQANAKRLCEKYEVQRREVAIVEERKYHLLTRELELTEIINMFEKIVMVIRNNDDQLFKEVEGKLLELKGALEDVKGELAVIKIVHGF